MTKTLSSKTSLLIIILGAINLSASVAKAECWLIAQDQYGHEFYQCNNQSYNLPICGSEFDRGNRCVVVGQQNGGFMVQPPQPNGNQMSGLVTGVTPFNAGGAPPVNAGGSWPNRAAEYSRGK